MQRSAERRKVGPQRRAPPRAPFRSAVLALALLMSTSTSPNQHEGGPVLGAGDHELSLEHGERSRSYLVHVPPRGAREGPLPVVLSFHGGGASAEGHRNHVSWEALADREGFVVVYPYGTGRFRRRLLTWNAGSCCGYAQNHEVDDVGFVRALLDDLERRLPIDESRVYATGFSNGGMFAYRLAAEAADRIAAIAPVAGVVLINSLNPSRPMPVLHIHSVDDPRALYAGGLGPPFPLTNYRVDHAAVETVLAQWLEQNQCPKEPEVADRLEGVDPSSGESQAAVKYVYRPCAAGTEIILWKLYGAGHVWPGVAPRRRRPEWLVGRSTQLFDANREIWEFFSRFWLATADNK